VSLFRSACGCVAVLRRRANVALSHSLPTCPHTPSITTSIMTITGSCPICLEDELVLTPLPCGHAYCAACLASIAHMSALACAMPGCPAATHQPPDTPDCVPVRALVPLFAQHAPLAHARGSTVALASAALVYYHYNTQGERDSGWGCAYRCLQMVLSAYVGLHPERSFELSHLPTIATAVPALIDVMAHPPSWHQGYAAAAEAYDRTCGNVGDGGRRVPSIWEIQLRLAYDMDTQGRFAPHDIGSHKWIEPFEIATFARRYGEHGARFAVEQPHAQRDSLLERLHEHFTTRRTPIAIDDLVLAYVLAGVCFDHSRSRVYLLRFDPHHRQPVSYDDFQAALAANATTTTTTPAPDGVQGVQWLPYERVFAGKQEWHFCWS